MKKIMIIFVFVWCQIAFGVNPDWHYTHGSQYKSLGVSFGKTGNQRQIEYFEEVVSKVETAFAENGVVESGNFFNLKQPSLETLKQEVLNVSAVSTKSDVLFVVFQAHGVS